MGKIGLCVKEHSMHTQLSVSCWIVLSFVIIEVLMLSSSKSLFAHSLESIILEFSGKENEMPILKVVFFPVIVGPLQFYITYSLLPLCPHLLI